jgi:hypothetical protein
MRGGGQSSDQVGCFANDRMSANTGAFFHQQGLWSSGMIFALH